MFVSPTAPASSAASRASSSSRPTSTSGCPGSASHANLVPKPPRSAVMHTADGMRLVELKLGAHVHHERAALLRLPHLARGERVHIDGLDDQRPSIQRDDVLE